MKKIKLPLSGGKSVTIDVKDIAESWGRALLPTFEQEEESNRRQAICDTCEHRSRLNMCKLCGCPLKGKTYSSFPCELGKWDK